MLSRNSSLYISLEDSWSNLFTQRKSLYLWQMSSVVELFFKLSAADEHVPEVEHSIRLINERVRSSLFTLPFTRRPRIMKKHLLSRDDIDSDDASDSVDNPGNNATADKQRVEGNQDETSHTYNLRQFRAPRFSSRYGEAANYLFTQMTARRGLALFRKSATEAIVKEFQQLNNNKVFIPK